MLVRTRSLGIWPTRDFENIYSAIIQQKIETYYVPNTWEKEVWWVGAN